MDKIREPLANCMRELESGSGSLETCLARYPEYAAELRPRLELWQSLNSGLKADPAGQALNRGRQRMLAALSHADGGGHMIPRYLTPAVVKVAAVVAGAVLLWGGAAGASAALGGPDLAGDAVSGIFSDGPDEHANVNALERCENAHDGRNNANENASHAGDHPNARAFEGGQGNPQCEKNDGAGEACDVEEDETDDVDGTGDEDADTDDGGDADEVDDDDADTEDEDVADEADDDDADIEDEDDADKGGDEDDADEVDTDEGSDDCADEADDDANENASEGADNSDDGINDADDSADHGTECASENAFEGSGNADDEHGKPGSSPAGCAGDKDLI